MAKRLANIEKNIIDETDAFYEYLKQTLPCDVWFFLETLISQTNVYLFSGVIRNYFMRRRTDALRDIDFIISDDINITALFPKQEIKRNSFGGYKLNIGELPIDIWVIKNTWALNYGQLKLSFSQLEHLPDTTFFNFSSVLFSLNQKQFILGKAFLRFLRDKKLDVVFEENPYPALCIVNSFYYSDKFSLKIENRLKQYILNKYEKYDQEFDKVQLKHFGKVLYTKNELFSRIAELKKT